MVLEIRSIGGYNEVGKNMTAIRVDNEVLILDMGIHLENYIRITQEEDVVKFGVKELIDAGAIPDISMLKEWRSLVSAIIPTHAHLDHVGAIPYLANKFAAPILCTPFTGEVIESILRDERIKLKNPIKKLNVNSTYQVSDTITVEFLNGTHSTPQTVIVAIHTPYGVILYANDFKFDLYPTFGKKPNLKRLEELGKEGKVHSLIVDSTYAPQRKKTPSESVAQLMLRDVLMGTDSSKKLVVVTTFSSHIARLKAIVEFAKKLQRKPVFLGRSLAKYAEAAEKANLINFSEDVEIVKFARKIKKKLRDVNKNKEERRKHLLVVTGHQGEPKSVLSRMINGEFDFEFEPEDHVVFSCTVIPTQTNLDNRQLMEDKLAKRDVRMFKDIHVSGHAAREDLRDLIHLVRPQHIIPAHGDFTMTSALVDLSKDIGYESVLLLQNGDSIDFT
ncbi:MAG: RNase J family beta-CASP ribonuclease [Candidatus Woesearchaeota archaeon]